LASKSAEAHIDDGGDGSHSSAAAASRRGLNSAALQGAAADDDDANSEAGNDEGAEADTEALDEDDGEDGDVNETDKEYERIVRLWKTSLRVRINHQYLWNIQACF
jgi:hypothetical protein